MIIGRSSSDGIEGLYVADASVMPTIPAVNTNLSTIVVAERIASLLSAL